MSIQKYNEQKAATKKAAEEAANTVKAETVATTAAPIPSAGTAEEVSAQMTANSSAGETVEEAEEADWISPYAVNYKELEEILAGEELSDYVGDRLPEEEVKRINTDYQLYLKNK